MKTWPVEGFVQRIPPFRTLDALRGFGAIWVVMVHCCDRFLAGDNLKYMSSPLYAFAICGQVGVLIFFIISGYCITAAAHGALYSGKALGRYSFERGRRIFPPYWTALIVGTLVALGLQVAEKHHWIPKINHEQLLPPSPTYWFANFTLTQYEFGTGFANIVFWSLCYEIAFYAVVGVILWAAKRVAKNRGLASGQWTLILGLALTTFASLGTLILFGHMFFPFSMWHQFAVGGLLFYLLESREETVAGYGPRMRTTLNAIAVITVVLCLALMAFRQVNDTTLIHPSTLVRTGIMLGVCFVLAAIKRFDEKIVQSIWMKPLLWVGACSYSLYLIHPVVLPFVDVLCRKAGLDGPRYWIAFWIQFVVAVAFGRAFYWLIERHFISSQHVKRLVEEKAA